MVGIQRLLRKLRNEESGNDGFTLVELMMAMVISLIILAGIVVLLSGTSDILKSNRNLLATTDASRRALSTITRQLRGALQLVNGAAGSTSNMLTFYADVRGEHSDADVVSRPNWENAPMIKWEFDAVNGVIKQTTTDPDETVIVSYIASNVKELKFDYYASGSDSPLLSPQDLDINKITSRIRITVKVQKGTTSRTLSQDVFLRVTKRIPEQEVVLIASVSPSSVTRPGTGTWTGTVTITGANTNFEQGRSVVYLAPSPSWIYLGTPTVISKTQLTVEGIVYPFVGPAEYIDVNVITGTETPVPKTNGFVVN